MIELLRREQIAVVGDGNGGHSAARRFIHQFLDIAGAVEKAVVRVQVQMNETRSSHAESIVVGEMQIFQRRRTRPKLLTEAVGYRRPRFFGFPGAARVRLVFLWS